MKGLLLTEEKVDRAVQLLAAAAKQAIPGTLGAGISLLDTQGRRTSSAATDKVVEQADTAQRFRALFALPERKHAVRF